MAEDKKKARWEENRDLIEAQKLEFKDLGDRYVELKRLVGAMAGANAEMVRLAQQNNRYALGRHPDRIKNKARKLEQMVSDLDD